MPASSCRQPLGHVQIDVAILELPRVDVRLRFGTEILGERGRIRIHVDEHETAEQLDLRLRQRELLAIDVREVPVADDALVRAVDVPAPAVEAALEFARATLACLRRAAWCRDAGRR